MAPVSLRALPAYQAGAEKKFDARLWEAYKEANARFADAVLEVWSAGPPTENDSTATAKVPGLRLGPRLPLDALAFGTKRRRDARVSVAWFLHTPFPSSRSIASCRTDGSCWKACCTRIWSGSTRTTTRDTFYPPVLVFWTFLRRRRRASSSGAVLFHWCLPDRHRSHLDRNTLKSRAVATKNGELGATFKGRKVLIGVDRLDYIKGMPHKP